MVAELNRALLASGMAKKLKQHEERAKYGHSIFGRLLSCSCLETKTYLQHLYLLRTYACGFARLSSKTPGVFASFYMSYSRASARAKW